MKTLTSIALATGFLIFLSGCSSAQKTNYDTMGTWYLYAGKYPDHECKVISVDQYIAKNKCRYYEEKSPENDISLSLKCEGKPQIDVSNSDWACRRMMQMTEDFHKQRKK